MDDNDIHVGRSESDRWLITHGKRGSRVASYRVKDHAMAYARALAYSRRVEMIVHDADGRVTRHERASLTYPTHLD